MDNKPLNIRQQIALKTALKEWKVELVLRQKLSPNLHRVTDDEMAIILHAAAELGYSNKGTLKGIMKKEVTLAMVAKRAGVSTSTVERSLKTGSCEISKETRDHVLKIVNELGYKPSHKKNLKNFYSRKA